MFQWGVEGWPCAQAQRATREGSATSNKSRTSHTSQHSFVLRKNPKKRTVSQNVRGSDGLVCASVVWPVCDDAYGREDAAKRGEATNARRRRVSTAGIVLHDEKRRIRRRVTNTHAIQHTIQNNALHGCTLHRRTANTNSANARKHVRGRSPMSVCASAAPATADRGEGSAAAVAVAAERNEGERGERGERVNTCSGASTYCSTTPAAAACAGRLRH